MLKTSLRYFMAVARHGSIRAASADLNIAQSAVSRHLQSLEWEVGTSLFERKPRGVVLTEAGELLFAHCLDSTFAIERLRSELDELRSLARGKVRLAAVESLLPPLGDAIAVFRTRYPGIEFSVDVATSDRALEAVRRADVDFGITLGGEFSRDIQVKHRSREPFLLAMRSDHPLARLPTLGLRDLEGAALALAPAPSSSRIIVDRCCARAGVAVTIALETNSVELMRDFALSGAGLTPMLRFAARTALTDGRLVARPLLGDELVVDVSLVTLTRRKLPLASERFVATVIECLEAAAAA